MSHGEAGRSRGSGRPPTEGALVRLLHVVWRFKRPMTLGARVVAVDPSRGVLLVKHGYVSGWHLPGGGVEPGETALDALTREAQEEANLAFDDPPSLHGIFFNRRVSKRDHVVVYVARRFRQTEPHRPSREIKEARFFPIDALPDDATPGTLARIAEVMSGRPPSAYW
jgi:8-oxo-dGTP pyrophosphatase MutT (NUDIX family)